MRNKKRRLFTWSLALAVRATLATAICLGSSSLCEAAAGSKHVLILSSFSPQSDSWNGFARTFRSELDRQSPNVVDFVYQSLGNPTASNERSEAFFVDYLDALYPEHPFDLIVAIAAPAANFVQRHRQRLFPKTPMIITAVENRRVQYDKLTEGDTVVATAIDAHAIVDNILRVLPLTKTIAIVNGGFSANERFWLGEVRRELAPLADRIGLKWYNELSLEDILKDVANLPPHSAIYWGLMNVDAAGVVYETSAVLKKLSSSANAPIFTYDDTFFGEGIVGGPMQSIAERSSIAAAVAVRILDGEKAGDIKTTPINLASPKFDWRQMQRWEIAESNLPPGSAIYFREPTVWERYWWQLALTVAVILLQAGFISILLREHRRRQLAEVQSRQRGAELVHVNRVATAGELTASIAHELNQPLGAILTNAETAKAILTSSSPDLVELNEIVDDILQDDRRASEVIRRMRSLLKKAPFELKNFDLNDLVRETVELIHTVGRKVELDSVITGDALPIRGDRIQLQQVVLNLVTNGIDAMKDTPDKNRIITIRTSRVEDFAQVSVSDRGHGIPEDKLKKVFEPFYTSKAEGMGMGLSIARTIVEAHNGQLSPKNRDHGGATFRIRLPLVP
jgi:signal transduction histidine kinase